MLTVLDLRTQFSYKEAMNMMIVISRSCISFIKTSYQKAHKQGKEYDKLTQHKAFYADNVLEVFSKKTNSHRKREKEAAERIVKAVKKIKEVRDDSV